MSTSSPRSTAHTSTRTRSVRYRSVSATPSRRLPGATGMATISARPLANASRCINEGNCSRPKISRAATFSGLTAMLRPSSSRSRYCASVYSGFRMRAMVCLQPSLRATMQHRRLVSSALVAAIIRSLSSTPASLWTAALAPLPSTTITSRRSAAVASAPFCVSTTTRSWPSRESACDSVKPTLPSPITTIFICPLVASSYPYFRLYHTTNPLANQAPPGRLSPHPRAAAGQAEPAPTCCRRFWRRIREP